jgi:hypothetical protein
MYNEDGESRVYGYEVTSEEYYGQDEIVEYDRFEDDFNVWEENQIALDNEYEDSWENLYGGDDYD